MHIWKIWGTNLVPLYIRAESLDEALSTARKVNENYCVCQVRVDDTLVNLESGGVLNIGQ